MYLIHTYRSTPVRCREKTWVIAGLAWRWTFLRRQLRPASCRRLARLSRLKDTWPRWDWWARIVCWAVIHYGINQCHRNKNIRESSEIRVRDGKHCHRDPSGTIYRYPDSVVAFWTIRVTELLLRHSWKPLNIQEHDYPCATANFCQWWAEDRSRLRLVDDSRVAPLICKSWGTQLSASAFFRRWLIRCLLQHRYNMLNILRECARSCQMAWTPYYLEGPWHLP